MCPEVPCATVIPKRGAPAATGYEVLSPAREPW
jgi:hypothetical protein